MASHKLDAIDRKILTELQADGRMTNVELASRVGISAPPCLRRVRALEEQGFIKGYHAAVDARELGFEVQVFAMVGLQSQAEADLSAFEAVPGCQNDDCTTTEGGFSPFAFGNSGRNILDGPGLFSINTGLSKNFQIKEGHRLQLRLETFNVLNRTNFIIQREMTFFNAPTAGLLSAVGGVGRGGGPRIFQYAAKLRF